MNILKLLRGGLNLDDSVEFMDPDDWSDANNIVTGRAYERKNGEKEPIRGTRALTCPYDITGSKLIGVVRSAQDNLNYLFFYNADASRNCILKFQNETFSLVLQWSGLNFHPDHPITGGLTDRCIVFTDKYNQPRSVNLTKWSGGSTPADEEEILLIKRGPQDQLDATESSETSGKHIGNIQFSYQYEYEDGELSVIAPWSRLIRSHTAAGAPIVAALIGLSDPTTVPDRVVKLKLIARKGENATPFYFLDVIKPFPVPIDISGYQWRYVDTSGGVVDPHYENIAELIPRLAGTACVTKSRLWLGDILEGYDVADDNNLNITLSTINPGGLSGVTGPTISSNSQFKYGYVFFDGEGRSSGVITKPEWRISTLTRINRHQPTRWIQYVVSGNVPSWARYYSVVTTKDLNKSNFYEGYMKSSNNYVSVDTAGVETYANTLSGTTKYTRLSMLEMNASGIYYAFKEGDLVYVSNWAGAGIHVGPMPVRKTVGDYIYIDAVNIGTATFDYHFQIYTPRANAEDLFYEFTSPFLFKTMPSRTPVAGGASIGGGIIPTYFTGDCVSLQLGQGTNDEMVQMSYKPNEIPWDFEGGKSFIVVQVGETSKPNFFRFSSPFIAGTRVNGISEFSLGDEANVPFEAIQIQRLQPTAREGTDGEVILAICNSDTYSIYVDEARLMTNDGSLLVSSTNVVGDVRKQRSGFGTLHPQSVHEEDGDVVWWDQLTRSYVRYSTNGIFPISEYKAVNHFEKQGQLNDENNYVISGYDPFYKMVFATFENALDDKKRTVGFSLTKERWISFYGFAPEAYIMGSDKMYSFNNDGIHAHDLAGDEFNSFYGDDAEVSDITVSFNENGAAPNEWKICQLQMSPEFVEFNNGYQQVAVDLTTDFFNDKGQSTSILADEFDVEEDLIYADIRGDENSDGGLVDGVPMYSNSIQCKVTFEGGTYKQFRRIQVGFEPSRGHKL